MDMPNRRQRRMLAKEAGYLDKKRSLSFKDRSEMNLRTLEVGKKIHLANIENNLRQLDEKAQQEEKEKIDSLIAGGQTPEEALKTIQKDNTP